MKRSGVTGVVLGRRDRVKEEGEVVIDDTTAGRRLVEGDADVRSEVVALDVGSIVLMVR